MDAVYHVLDISKEEARQFTLYIAENHLTLTDAIERKYHLSLSEYDDYMEVVLMPYANYCGRKSLQLGKELVDILAVVFAE